MTALSIQPTYPTFTDIDGQPLEAGYIWIGTANLNPLTNPISVYWDAALTLPAAQPIRTVGGYPVNSGTPARLYVDSDYSIQVQNRNGSVVYSAPAATERLSGVVIEIDSTDVSFIQAGTGAVARTAQAKLRDAVSLKDFGAVGNGVADDLPSAENAIAAHDVVELVGDEVYNFNSDQNGLFVGSTKTIRGTGQAELLSTTLNYRPLQIDQASTSPTGVVIQGVTLKNNVSNTDDWSPVRFGGAQASMYHGNHTKQAYYGATFSHSIYNDRTEIRTKDFSAVGNLSQGNGTGYEIFSVKNAAFAGNAAYKVGSAAVEHGFRVTGHGATMPAPGTDLSTFGVALAGNSVNNYGNGISQQLGVYGCTYSGMALTQCVNGIQLAENNTSASDQSKGNAFTGITIHSVANGIRAEKSEKHVFSGIAIRNATFYGIGMLVATSGSTHGTGRFNRFDGGIYDHSGGTPLLFEGSNSRVDVTIGDIISSVSTVAIVSGNFNVVTITGGNYASTVGNFLRITGNNNIVTIAANDVAQAFQEIQIAGNNNVLICNLDVSDGGGEVLIASGTGNQVIGHCKITGTVPAGNRIDGIFYGQSQGTTTATTDASGDISITYGYQIIGVPSVVVSHLTAAGGTPRILQVHNQTINDCKVRVFDTTGAAVVGASVTVAWNVTAASV